MILTNQELQALITLNVNQIIAELNTINVTVDNTNIINNINAGITRLVAILNPANNQ